VSTPKVFGKVARDGLGNMFLNMAVVGKRRPSVPSNRRNGKMRG
jgi:hypothetical protein